MMMQVLMGLVSVSVWAQSNPDLKQVKFSGQIVSKAPYELKFKAPKDHHFNQEAPAKVEIVNGDQTQAGKIEKTLQTVDVGFPKEMKLAANCAVKAQLFVCDDGNKYCLPIKQEFDCQKLQVKN